LTTFYPSTDRRLTNMFNFRDDNAMMRPPAVVTTMGQLKQQLEEPDWYHPPQKQHVESREQHWTGYDRGGNSLVEEDRDTRMPMHTFPYSSPKGRGQTPLSPRQQQFMSSREAASYMTAIKAVDDSLYSDGGGSVTVLRGLWKVFDSVVSELGTELTASLANKAVFEGEIVVRIACTYGVLYTINSSSFANKPHLMYICPYSLNYSEHDAGELASPRQTDHQSRDEIGCTVT